MRKVVKRCRKCRQITHCTPRKYKCSHCGGQLVKE